MAEEIKEESMPPPPPPAPPSAHHVRPPNRPAHEKFLEESAQALSVLENRRRFLQDRLKGFREQLGRLRSERDSVTEERNAVEERLSAANKEVTGRSEQLQKLRQGIPYLSEDRIDEQIKTLEHQMMRNHYKRTEENKIITEVNRLKRSKKALKEHNALKSEVDAMRRHQRQTRERRDHLFRRRGEIKRAEDGLKKDVNEIKEELDRIKASIDEVFAVKRQTVAEFRAQEAEHKKFLWERRSEQRMRKREEREAAEAEKQREWEEIKANTDPYDEELRLIANLIQYCLRFEVPSAQPATANTTAVTSNGFLAVPGQSGHPRRGSHESGLKVTTEGNKGEVTPSPEGSSIYSTPMATTPVASTPVADSSASPGFAYYKKDSADADDGALFAGVTKKTSRRNSRNERRNSRASNKMLNHVPEVFAQFARFGLTPPACSKDVTVVIGNLKDKQGHFEKLAVKEKEARALGQQPGSTIAAATKSPTMKERTVAPPADLPIVVTEDTSAAEKTADEVDGGTTVVAEAKPVENDKSPTRPSRRAPKSNGKLPGKSPPKKFDASEEAFPSLPSPAMNPSGMFSSPCKSPATKAPEKSPEKEKEADAENEDVGDEENDVEKDKKSVENDDQKTPPSPADSPSKDLAKLTSDLKKDLQISNADSAVVVQDL